MSLNRSPDKPARGPAPGRGRISARSRNINILLFIVTLCVMAAVMIAAFGAVTKNISAGYAESYAVNSSDALSVHIDKEIGLMSRAAGSDAVIEWMADEFNEEKKAAAFERMNEIVGELYSFNLYVGVESSLNEYRLDSGEGKDETTPFDVLDRSLQTDKWFFDCLDSENEYILSVDIDRVMQRKRVWLDYKVVRDGVTLGAVCTGLEFSHVLGEIFSHHSNMRGLIIDENGMIHMDNSLMSNRNFLYDTFERPITGEFADPALLGTVESFLASADGYATEIGAPVSVALSTGPYLYMTIVPIRSTSWAVVILSGDTSLFDLSLFIPAASAALALLILFAIVTSAVNYRLIFRPLGKLERSLTLMKDDDAENIYGAEREDELGHLARTIKDLFGQANVDALTGIYNRRYMETSLERVIGLLSRSGGSLSVLMLDIDYFKKYNDTYGHDQGDVCLRAVAQALAGTVKRTGDFTARYGGEEFVAVLPSTDADGARRVAEKLIENVTALNIPHEKNDAAPCVTVSIGVTHGAVEYGRHWEDYLKRADEALYASKQGGRNRYTYLEYN